MNAFEWDWEYMFDPPDGFTLQAEQHIGSWRWGDDTMYVFSNDKTGDMFGFSVRTTTGDHGPNPELSEGPYAVEVEQVARYRIAWKP